MKSLQLCLSAPGADRSQPLSSGQHLAVPFPRGIHVQVQFEKRSRAVFGSLQVRLRSGVKFTKKILLAYQTENSTLEQHIGPV